MQIYIILVNFKVDKTVFTVAILYAYGNNIIYHTSCVYITENIVYMKYNSAGCGGMTSCVTASTTYIWPKIPVPSWNANKREEAAVSGVREARHAFPAKSMASTFPNGIEGGHGVSGDVHSRHSTAPSNPKGLKQPNQNWNSIYRSLLQQYSKFYMLKFIKYCISKMFVFNFG